jgi:hypothetical protein
MAEQSPYVTGFLEEIVAVNFGSGKDCVFLFGFVAGPLVIGGSGKPPFPKFNFTLPKGARIIDQQLVDKSYYFPPHPATTDYWFAWMDGLQPPTEANFQNHIYYTGPFGHEDVDSLWVTYATQFENIISKNLGGYEDPQDFGAPSYGAYGSNGFPGYFPSQSTCAAYCTAFNNGTQLNFETCGAWNADGSQVQIGYSPVHPQLVTVHGVNPSMGQGYALYKYLIQVPSGLTNLLADLQPHGSTGNQNGAGMDGQLFNKFYKSIAAAEAAGGASAIATDSDFLHTTSTPSVTAFRVATNVAKKTLVINGGKTPIPQGS